jgi:hypothetical protein
MEAVAVVAADSLASSSCIAAAETDAAGLESPANTRAALRRQAQKRGATDLPVLVVIAHLEKLLFLLLVVPTLLRTDRSPSSGQLSKDAC